MEHQSLSQTDYLPPLTPQPQKHNSLMTGECIACPRLNDAVREKDCQLRTNGSVLSWPTWTNEGHRCEKQERGGRWRENGRGTLD